MTSHFNGETEKLERRLRGLVTLLMAEVQIEPRIRTAQLIVEDLMELKKLEEHKNEQ